MCYNRTRLPTSELTSQSGSQFPAFLLTLKISYVKILVVNSKIKTMIKELRNIIENQEIENYYHAEPQYEAYGDTFSIVGYNYTPEQENAMYEEQKRKTIQEIENNEFLEWDFVNKYWDRLMEKDKLLERVKRIFINFINN